MGSPVGPHGSDLGGSATGSEKSEREISTPLLPSRPLSPTNSVNSPIEWPAFRSASRITSGLSSE